MNRYSRITGKNPREIVLLRGSGCKWRQCAFCDYHLDFSKNEAENFRLNRKVLAKVTGIYGVLEVINSGSFCDLDAQSVQEILRVMQEKKIAVLHLECHWRDRETLPEVRERFRAAGIRVVVKMGVETFDAPFREQILRKGMEGAAPEQIAIYADEICLLFGIAGQSRESMKRDIEIGLQLFQRICINLMVETTARLKPDKDVLECFMNALYPVYREDPRVDILIENTDFGVGGEADDQ